MKHRQEQDSFQGQVKPSADQQPFHDLGKLQFVPEPTEDQRRSDPAVTDRRHSTFPMCIEHQSSFGELGSRLQQAIQLAALLEFIQPSHRGDDSLLTTSLDPLVLDDLKVNVIAGTLLAEEHGGLLAELIIATMRLPLLAAICRVSTKICGTMMRRRQHGEPQKHRGFWPLTHLGSSQTVEDGSSGIAGRPGSTKSASRCSRIISMRTSRR